MDDKVVVLRVGEHLFSLPFIHVDEILSADMAVTASNLPEGAVPDETAETLFVSSRGQWLGVRKLLPDQVMVERSQIVVVTCDESARALMVDQVMGIENSGEITPFPDVVIPFIEIPFAGVRFLRDQSVLELDLSRLISLDIGDWQFG
jgi:chemotaxis signal transduction protein